MFRGEECRRGDWASLCGQPGVQSNPKVLMAWPDLPEASNKPWALVRAGLFIPGDGCQQEPWQSACGQWCKCCSCCCFAYGVAEQWHSQFFSLLILGRKTWERRSDPNNSGLGCLPPALPSCSWEKALGTCNSPHTPNPTCEYSSPWWTGLVTSSLWKTHRTRTLSQEHKAEEFPVCPFLSDCPRHEDTHSQPPLSTLLCPTPASQPPHCVCWVPHLSLGFPTAHPCAWCKCWQQLSCWWLTQGNPRLSLAFLTFPSL